MRSIIKEEVRYQPCPNARLPTTALSTDGEYGNEVLVAEKKEIGIRCLQRYEY